MDELEIGHAAVDDASRWRPCPAASGRASRWRGRPRSGAGVVIMDEPTAALGVKESGQVLDLIRRVRDRACRWS